MGGSEIQNRSLELKLKASFLVEALGGNVFLVFSSSFQNCPHSLAPAYLTPTFASVITSPSLTLTLFPPSYEDPWVYHEYVQIIQDDLPISRPFHLVTHVEFLLLLTYLQVLGMGMWTSFEDHFSVRHKC